MAATLLKSILDDEFLETLAKSADLYKIGSNSVLDPQEILIGLKVVPRAIMSLLISELTPMGLNSHKDVQLPFGKVAYISANKNAADDYTGSIYSDNKLVYDFKNRSIPGLGVILLSTFELYDLEDLNKPSEQEEGVDRKVQKLIDERMEMHSLVGRVVEDKLAQREAIHKIMMAKLGEAIATKSVAIPSIATKIAEVRKIHEDSTPKSDPYFRGMTNGMAVASSVVSGKEPDLVSSPKKPIEVKPADITKKETASKGSPLKGFLERKKKPKEYHVEIAKSETVDCDSCNQTIFGSGGYSGCLCMGQDQNRKVWIKKSEHGVQLRFSRGWSEDNIELLLETLRKNNGKH